MLCNPFLKRAWSKEEGDRLLPTFSQFKVKVEPVHVMPYNENTTNTSSTRLSTSPDDDNEDDDDKQLSDPENDDGDLANKPLLTSQTSGRWAR
jgi:hypothetical protein